jgi:O-antigen/teichoic acid export membrane protein
MTSHDRQPDPPNMSTARGVARRGRGATGAVGAQLAQALASLVLSIAAARSLGADGLGIYGLISGGLVLATAIATGLVGDSLTVLDRRTHHLRAGLQIVGCSCALLAGIVGATVCWAAGLLSWQASVMFGVGSTAFILEEYLRRLLMASLKFWSVMVVDLACLGATICWLGFAAAFGALDMFQILLALLVSQIIAMIVAVRLLPHSELELAPWRLGDVTSVLQFGGWRAAQQAVRPAMLTAMRILVVIATGTVVFGELEAARVYAAPTLLIVNGIGGYLFATYAAKKREPAAALVRHADIGALTLFVSVLLVGAIAATLLPWAGGIVTGAKFSIDGLAVFGWVLYAAAAGVLMPYGTLAAVTGMHVRVFVLRVFETAVSLTAVAVVVFPLHASPSWVPATMALGTVALGVVIRQRVLLPQARTAPQSYEDVPTSAGVFTR